MSDKEPVLSDKRLRNRPFWWFLVGMSYRCKRIKKGHLRKMLVSGLQRRARDWLATVVNQPWVVCVTCFAKRGCVLVWRLRALAAPHAYRTFVGPIIGCFVLSDTCGDLESRKQRRRKRITMRSFLAMPILPRVPKSAFSDLRNRNSLPTTPSSKVDRALAKSAVMPAPGGGPTTAEPTSMTTPSFWPSRWSVS